MIKNYPIHIEPGKGRYVFIFVLNERAVTGLQVAPPDFAGFAVVVRPEFAAVSSDSFG